MDKEANKLESNPRIPAAVFVVCTFFYFNCIVPICPNVCVEIQFMRFSRRMMLTNLWKKQKTVASKKYLRDWTNNIANINFSNII